MPILYVIVALTCFLTHYFAYFTWGALNLIALVRTLRRQWSPKLSISWWAAQGFLLLVYLPWAIWTLPLTTTFRQPWINEMSAGNILWRELTALNLGYTLHLGEKCQSLIPWMITALALAAFAGVILAWMRPRNRRGLRLGLTLFLAPLVVMYLASLWRPLFDEKYAIALLPLYLVLLAAGIIEMSRRSRLVGMVITLVVVSTMSLATLQVLTNTDNAKSPDWRELFTYMQSKSQSGDLLLYDFPEPTILFYNHDRLPTALVPRSGKLPRQEIVQQLEDSIAGYDRVWLIPLVRSWWDREGDVPVWLDTYADRVDIRFFRGVHLALYLPPESWQETMTHQSRRTRNEVELLGFRLGPPGSNSPVIAEPDKSLALSLYWHSNGATDISLTVFTHLIGPDGLVYGQWDNPPVGGAYPTTKWQPGEQIVDQYHIPVNENAPPGAYRLVIGMYDPATGERVLWEPVSDEDEKMSDSIQLEKDVLIR